MRNDEIYKLLELQSESINKTIRYGLKGIRQYVDAGSEAINLRLDTIKDLDEKRNGKIEKLEKETGVMRWMHRNPIPSAIAVLIIIMIGAFGYHRINIKKTVENITKIELKDE